MIEDLEGWQGFPSNYIPKIAPQAPAALPHPNYIIASGIYSPPLMGYLEEKPELIATPEDIGNKMILTVDRMKAKDLGDIVREINSALITLSQQHMSRDGWEKYEKLVNLFEEITGYEE